MTDESDVVLALVWGCPVLLIIVLVMYCADHDTCAQMKCERGKPHVIDHACLCLEDAR